MSNQFNARWKYPEKRAMAWTLFALLLLFEITVVEPLSYASSGVPQIQQMPLRPLAFTPNHGQWADSILYRGSAVGPTLWFTKSGIYYQFVRTTSHSKSILTAKDTRVTPKSPLVENLMIKASFEGANLNSRVFGDQQIEYKTNYFLGNDPARWQRNLPAYEALEYANIYDGINLRFHGNGNQMEYDFQASPGADLSQIKMSYEGAKSLTVDSDGNLVIETAWGNMVEETPTIYQEQEGQRKLVPGSFTVDGGNTAGFKITGNYDATQPLTIDPVLTYSTYLGGSLLEEGRCVGVASTGEVVVSGYTTSSNFPIKVGAYDNTYSANRDIFVTEFDATGTNLVYSTYMGGSQDDDANAMYLYNSSSTPDVFLTGSTLSPDFPVNAAIDPILNGEDAFVARLTSGGSSLDFSTFLGGTNDESGNAIVVRCAYPCGGSDTRVFVAGSTTSTNFPLANAYTTTLNGTQDAFLTEISLSTILSATYVYSTYFGGSLTESALGLTVTGTGFHSQPFVAYLTGRTYSSDFPITAGCYDNTYAGPSDAFVSVMATAGNGQVYPLYSTLFGGNGAVNNYTNETGFSIAVTGGNICIAGVTTSSGLGTPGSFQPTYAAGGSDAFVAEFNNTLSSLVFCTYLGGTQREDIDGINGGMTIDYLGNITVVGTTESADFPTANAYNPAFSGIFDVFIARLNPTGSLMKFGTYLGGNNSDFGRAIAVDGSGCMYVTGYTKSANYPVGSPYDGALNGTQDAFLTKICEPLYICGDASGDGTVNISDAVFLISYIFAGGPAPSPLQAGDVNCDATVNISDVVYLINYIFSGGPAPCASCK